MRGLACPKAESNGYAGQCEKVALPQWDWNVEMRDMRWVEVRVHRVSLGDRKRWHD